MKRARLALAFVATALLDAGLAAPARGQTAPLIALHVVRLDGADTCAPGAELARAVELRLGRAVFGAPGGDARSVEVVVTRRGESYRADVRSFDERGLSNGQRSVEPSSGSCSALTEALAVVLSVMIDPAAALAPVPAKPASAPPDTAPAPPPAQPVVRSLVPRVEPTRRTLGVFARLSFGVLPSASAAFGAAYEQSLPVGGVRIEASASLRDEALLDQRSEGIRMAIASGALMYCPLFNDVAFVRFTACAGAEGGAWFVSNVGVSTQENLTDPFAAGVARVGIGFALGPLIALQLGGTAQALVLRPEYALNYTGSARREQLYRAPAIAGSLDAGLAVQF